MLDASTQIEEKRIHGTVDSVIFRGYRQGQRARGIEIIRAPVEVTGNNGAFSIMVYAENLRQAEEIAANQFPGRAVSVRFPLDPEVFFIEGSTAGSKTVALVTTKE